jgi:hypothetical protein
LKAVYLALIHHPVYNNIGQVVATAVTNLDVHDLSRLALTFGCNGFFVVNPLELQKKLLRRLMMHWLEGRGSEFNLTRKQAFELVRLADSLEDAKKDIQAEQGEKPRVVATTARMMEGLLSYEEMRDMMSKDEGVWLVIFGTGWGLTAEFIQSEADHILEPIQGAGDYNHLSVRSAAAIVLDRLFSARAHARD